METTDLPELPQTVLCYDPASMEPIMIADSLQQNFPVPLDIPDKRAKVQSPLKYPYNCIGLVLTFFKNDEVPFYSTGCLLDHNKVLTAAHNVYMKIRLNSPVADKVYFLPSADGLIKNEEAIAAASFDYCPYFPPEEFSKPYSLRSCDYAVLTLSKSVRREKYFRIFPPIWSQLLREVKMVGYAADKAELRPIRLWQQEVEGECQVDYEEGIINYGIYTNLGMSGSPLFVENENDGHCYVMGIHHGLLKGDRENTGGAYLTEKTISHIN